MYVPSITVAKNTHFFNCYKYTNIRKIPLLLPLPKWLHLSLNKIYSLRHLLHASLLLNQIRYTEQTELRLKSFDPLLTAVQGIFCQTATKQRVKGGSKTLGLAGWLAQKSLLSLSPLSLSFSLDHHHPGYFLLSFEKWFSCLIHFLQTCSK